MEVYETQLAQGRRFLHQHLENASTWGSPRMQALREHPRSGVIYGKRGAQWPEMRGSDRSTKDLSAAPELQGAPNRPPASSEIRCEALPHHLAEKEFRCVNNHSEAQTVVAPCSRWTHPKRKCCQGSRERRSVTKRRIWPWVPRSCLGRLHPGGGARCLDRDLHLTRTSVSCTNWHVWDVLFVGESWNVLGKAPLHCTWGRRQQGRPRETCGSKQVCRERSRERSRDHQNR